MREAMFYERMEGDVVHCFLCAHSCIIKEGRRGVCMVRENRGGMLYSLVYGKAISMAIDPIEKKPLYHFLPGSTSLSMATVGCNFRCLHCQNAAISQLGRGGPIRGQEVAPSELVMAAQEGGCASISYTYTEPTIFLEYALDTARLAKEVGIRNVFVTNGYITPEPLRALAPYLDGANIDLKSFSEEFYRKICGARLGPVLEAIKLYRDLGIWMEITTLIIPNHNDSDEELGQIAQFIAQLGLTIPWHISAFHPTYKLHNQPRTPLDTLLRARDIGRLEGLRYIYLGNIPSGEGGSTLCPQCKVELIGRTGFSVKNISLIDGHCPHCGAQIEGVWA